MVFIQGKSIVVCPSQTLNDTEYFLLREIAIKTIRHLEIVGECNIQYALDPQSQSYRVIEVNARLSRSSALASKATGYPLAYIAAKLSLGYRLTELENLVTRSTKACFEPALDYIVVKAPRWDLKKFEKVSRIIGSGMKSIGEVMALGRTFLEALQKAIRMIDVGALGILDNKHITFPIKNEELLEQLEHPTDERIFFIAEAMKRSIDIDTIHKYTYVDKWFLSQIEVLAKNYLQLKNTIWQELENNFLRELKQQGFSDKQIANILAVNEEQVAEKRHKNTIIPFVKQIDTLGGEYPAKTHYLYVSYNAIAHDIVLDEAHARKKIIILGSGCYRIGSSVEFDWCTVEAVKTLTKRHYYPIVINYNPETVSTDYDEVEKLYFEEVSLETIKAIYEYEKAEGVIVSVGGQTANNTALKLQQQGIKILGTSPHKIDQAEDRHKFSSLLDTLGIDQPQWIEVNQSKELEEFINLVGYPLIIRPSYVLSGSAMAVISNEQELNNFIGNAVSISEEHPVVLSKFIEYAKEIEFDGVAHQGNVIDYVISEHIEEAGVHSGDATLVLPPRSISLELQEKIAFASAKIAEKLSITGPFNIQFIVHNDTIKVIECNLRASRSFPFVSKTVKKNFIALSIDAILGVAEKNEATRYSYLPYFGVKASQFSFSRLTGADPILGVDMSSTGEVGCLSRSFYEALLKALLSVGFRIPLKNILISAGPLERKKHFLPILELLKKMNIKVYTTFGTYNFFLGYDYTTELIPWPAYGEKDVLDLIEKKPLDLVINIPKNFHEAELTNDYLIRRKAVDYNIPLITNTKLAIAFIEAIYKCPLETMEIYPLNYYIPYK